MYPHWTDLLSKYLETNQKSSKWENFSNNICTYVKPYSLDTEVINNKASVLYFFSLCLTDNVFDVFKLFERKGSAQLIYKQQQTDIKI